METKNILFSVKKFRSFLYLTLLLFVVGCAQFKTRSEISQSPIGEAPAGKSKASTDESLVVPETRAEAPPLPLAPPPAEPTPSPIPEKPKIGIILGPGGLRSFAHIGVLQEIDKMRLPVHSIVGVEFAAIPAAIFANKGFANETEWQMFKLKESEVTQAKGLLTKGGPMEASLLEEFFRNAFNGARAESSKFYFSCPAYNLEKRQVFWMARGTYEQLLPFCVTSQPLYKPFKSNTAYMWSLYEAKKHLKSRGANFIIFVDVMSFQTKSKSHFRQEQESDRIFWSVMQDRFQSEKSHFDFVLSVPLQDYYFDDYEHRREILLKGQEAAQSQLPKLMKALGL